MQAQQALRLLKFKATLDDDVIEEAIQVAIAPGPDVVAGLLWTLVGRCVRVDGRSYVLATLWEDREAMLAAVRDGDVAVYRPAFAPYLARAAVAVLDVDAAWRWCGPDPLATIRLFWVADLGLGADSTPHERSMNVGPASEEGFRPPCLALSAGSEAEHIVLSGWTGPGQPSSGRPTPGDAAAVVATVTEMLSAGLGEEYEVVVDLAAESG